MNTQHIETTSGHWLLAKVGKKVLRPGGRLLTGKLLNSLNISKEDRVVELAPGLGYTAKKILESQPQSYTGIDADEDAVQLLKRKIIGKQVEFKLANARETGLQEDFASKILGEAMLTMQAPHRKKEIVQEVYRVLKKGGLYGIHELALIPDEISAKHKKSLEYDLAQSMKVNARPLTTSEWKSLLEEVGFKIVKVEYADMKLLQPERIIEDEGFLRFLKIAKNVLLNPDIKKRIIHMRSTFKKYETNLKAIMIIAQK